MEKQYTAAELAKVLGVSVETVRERAAAGKIKGTKQKTSGRWVFDHDELVLAGTITSGGLLPLVETRQTDVIFVLDASTSMDGLLDQAQKNLQEQLAELAKASDASNRYDVTVLVFSSKNKSRITAKWRAATGVGSADSLYVSHGGMTALNDALLEAVHLAASRDDGKRSFLISVITDGEENDSVCKDLTAVAAHLKRLTATDRYTFTYAGPHVAEGYARSAGFLPGNITSWSQTTKGVVDLGARTTSGLSNYTASRGMGQTMSMNFYASPVTKDAGNFAAMLGNNLGALGSHEYSVLRVSDRDPIVISKFCEKRLGTFPKGKVYYQLTESEKVQDYKKVVIQDLVTGNFYAGEKQAMGLLGIPNFTGTAKIRPGDLGQFQVFVQSMSYNRKLTPNTAVVVLK